MASDNTDSKSNYLDREENITKGNLSAKKIAMYYYDSGSDLLQPYTGSSSNSGVVDANNSTTTTLLANATYTGTSSSILNYSSIALMVYADVAAAANGVQIQFSEDNTNWDDSSSFSFTPGTAPNQGQAYKSPARAQYYRVVYINGSTNQTTFRLQTLLKTNAILGDSVAIGTTINSTQHSLLTTSRIVGKTTAGGGGFVDVKVNPSGALTAAATIADGDDVATGATADAANTTGTTGTVSGKLRGIVQNQTNGTQKTKITDGTYDATVVSPGAVSTTTPNAEGNATAVGFTTKSFTYSYSAVTTGTTYDVANFASVKLQITSQYVVTGTASTVTFQTSNDGTNWYSQSLMSATGSQSSATTSTTSSGIIYVGNLTGRYFRINVTGTYVSGTAAGIITFSTAPYAPLSVGASISLLSGSNTGTITTASSTVTSSTLTGYNYAYVRFSGTYAGVGLTITQSDDSQTTFIPTPVYDINFNAWLTLGNSNTAPNIVLGTNETRTFIVPLLPSGTAVRVVSNAWTSGTANVRITYTANPWTPYNTAPAHGNIGTAPPLSGSYQSGKNILNALPTATSSGQLTGMSTDKYGRQIILTNTIRDLVTSQTTTITASTTETTIVTAAASVFNDLSAIWFNNTSASAVRVDVRDTTAGTVKWQIYIPAGDVRGITFNTPYPQAAVNTNWTAQCSASVTDVRITALYIKNA